MPLTLRRFPHSAAKRRQEPELNVFDEPTRGVDVGAIAEIHQLLNSLADEGKAVVVISSYLPEVMAISDRILVARQGKVVEEFSALEATEEKNHVCGYPLSAESHCTGTYNHRPACGTGCIWGNSPSLTSAARAPGTVAQPLDLFSDRGKPPRRSRRLCRDTSLACDGFYATTGPGVQSSPKSGVTFTPSMTPRRRLGSK